MAHELSSGDAAIAPFEKALSSHPHHLFETDTREYSLRRFGEELGGERPERKEGVRSSGRQVRSSGTRRGNAEEVPAAEEGGRAAEQGGERTCGRGARSRAGRSATGEHGGVTADQGGGVTVAWEHGAAAGGTRRLSGGE
ncbi:hypothetical protein Syun_026331 [Stephania yunnanensis]|uniref:Uncharacterized protein n=1 Tax=Stephania yunnanensis TaxID=152371 RepID=A0AAP0HWL6_9MAGN